MTPSEPSQTIEIQVVKPTTQTNPNLLIVMGVAAGLGRAWDAGVQKVAAGVQNVAAGVQNVVLVPVGRAWDAWVQKVAAGVQKVAVAGVQGIVVPVGRAWVAFEEGVAENPPPPRNDLIVAGLIGFVAIKAQGDQGFPFRTHPGLFKLSIISLLLYGFASAAEQLLVPVRLRAVACLGRGVSLGILVGSLASFFFV